jgi:aminotransferase
MLKLSHRTDSIAQSEIRAMSILCRDHDGINMAQGLCDLDVPAPVLEGAQNAMTSGHNIYTSSFGVHTLRQRIAEKQSQWHDQPTTDSEVLVSMGATGAFYTTAQVLLNEGDEVLMFEPYYGYHVSTLQSIGCRVRFIRTLPPSYTIDFDELRDAISPRTKAVLICNPANPSGKVYTREELEQLGTLCEAHNLMLFSDEMYEHFVYDDTPYTSARSISALRERSVIISGFSKIYSITGWRIGYALPRHMSSRQRRTSMTLSMSVHRHPCNTGSSTVLKPCRKPITPRRLDPIRKNATTSSVCSTMSGSKPTMSKGPIMSWPTSRRCPAVMIKRRSSIS